MTATAEPLVWSAYCEECDWESERFGYKRGAEIAANTHNEENHS